MRNYTEPALPLTRDQFADALQQGLGRAVMHAARHGVDALLDLVIAASVENRSYDPQCEGDRADWMLEIADAAGVVPAVAPRVVEALARHDAGYRDAVQLCALGHRLALRGHAPARDALYAAFRKSSDSMDLIGAREIIELDGADGLLHVAAEIGRWIGRDPTILLNDEPLLIFDGHHDKGAARRILDAARSTNADVARYLARLDGLTAKSKDGPVTPGEGRKDIANVPLSRDGPGHHAKRMQRISAQDVINDITNDEPARHRYWFHSWGKHAPAVELLAVLRAMQCEENPGRLCKCLHVFAGRAMPELNRQVLALADHENSDVRRAAYRALQHLNHPDIHRLAADRARAGRTSERELLLFKSTFQTGDEHLIEPNLRPPEDREALHRLVFDLVEVFEDNAVPEAGSSMMFVYEESPCSNCRHVAVKTLLRAGRAPAWMVEECRHDVDETTRSLVAGPPDHAI